MDKLIASILIGAFAFAILILVGALMALPVMWLWNWLLAGPDSIISVALPQIGFLQAWGLLVLTSTLFKSSGSTSSGK